MRGSAGLHAYSTILATKNVPEVVLSLYVSLPFKTLLFQ